MLVRARHPLLRRIGVAIRASRLRRGLSQESLAGLAHIDRSYISSIERGLRNVSVLNIARIAEVLNVPIRDLIAAGEPRPPRPAVVPDPALEFASLPPIEAPPPTAPHEPWEPGRYLSLG